MVTIMNIDFIERLKSDVTAIVLQGETEHLFAKDQALTQFYPIFLNILRARPAWIENLGQQLNPKIHELFNANPALKQQFLDQVDQSAPQDEIEHTLNRSIVPTMNFLQTEAGASSPEAISHLLETHADSIQRALPLWAGPILAALGVSPLAGQNLNQEPVLAEQTIIVQEERKTGFLWPFIIFLILAGLILFLVRSCMQDDVEDSNTQATSEVAAAQPASLRLSTGSNGEIVSCQLQLNNPQYMEILQNEIKQIFNYNIGCGALSSEVYHSEFIDQDTIPTVLRTMQGMPNVSLDWIGNQVSVRAATNAEAERLAAQIRSLAKNVTVVTQQPLNRSDVINTANSEAEQALASIKTDNVKALDVATALNLQIINFDTASTEVPEVNKLVLDQAAALLQRAPHVILKVTGHADAQGSEAENKVLSVQRAQAITSYLVGKGVNPAQLQAVGMGEDQPVEPNATPAGQFQNRRVTFEVVNTETGIVREVDDEGVVEKTGN
ncbi:OmpA family protein [Acinetobacter lwoffii]|uniref:OmpA family protein n=1 Tax=Acinetobacter lwoffii TaxID=28090 RepID=A0AAJ4P1U3_ACILW|nr:MULTISPECIES: OmpA family protein [Acinetobacter]SPJ19411.1 Outer membrane porin F precursor [Prolinoborus fasciculus]MCO8078020.1 OmpA family protein [Acinetobacter lwoffii]MCU4420586.1 OmpA family protein [Acinetobacter lwoffii]MCU4438887.1 OmpA family protein [Acinetobacter lwoffii]MCU4449074.1 OmpA family protein [Acinetobacter lwoffii]